MCSCIFLGLRVERMNVPRLVIHSQAWDTSIKPGISITQYNKMLQIETSLWESVVPRILTREPWTTCCSQGPGPSQAKLSTRILHCPPEEGADSIKEKGRGKSIPVSNWNQRWEGHNNQMDIIRHPLPGPQEKEWARMELSIRQNPRDTFSGLTEQVRKDESSQTLNKGQ